MKRRVVTKQRHFMHFTGKKRERERSKRCHFEWHHKSSSSPGPKENKGRTSICSPAFPAHSLSQNPKTNMTEPPPLT